MLSCGHYQEIVLNAQVRETQCYVAEFKHFQISRVNPFNWNSLYSTESEKGYSLCSNGCQFKALVTMEVLSLSSGNTIQDPQWMPETRDITKIYIFFFLYIHMYDEV